MNSFVEKYLTSMVYGQFIGVGISIVLMIGLLVFIIIDMKRKKRK